METEPQSTFYLCKLLYNKKTQLFNCCPISIYFQKLQSYILMIKIHEVMVHRIDILVKYKQCLHKKFASFSRGRNNISITIQNINEPLNYNYN